MTEESKDTEVKATAAKIKPSDIEIPFAPDYDNERMLLVACATNMALREYVLANTHYTDYLIPQHKAIIWTLKELRNRGLSVKETTFNAVVQEYEYYDDGLRVQHHMFRQILPLANEIIIESTQELDVMVDKLKVDSLRWQLIHDDATQFIDLLLDRHNTPEDLYNYLVTMARKIGEFVSSPVLFGEELMEAYEVRKEELKKKGVLRTGWVNFDRIFHGFRPGELTTIAGRPSMGKSAFALNLANQVLDDGGCILYFTLEMTTESQIDRLLSMNTGIAHSMIVDDTLSEEQRKLVENVKKWIMESPIGFYDKRGSTILDVEAAISQISATGSHPDLVIIDLARYLKDFQGDQKETENALMGLHTVAKQYDTHVMLVVQINREVEKRKDPRPRLSDIKWSGGYEEISDQVLLLYRKSYYEEELQEKEGVPDVVEVIFGKQRSDVGGVAIQGYLRFVKSLLKMDDIEQSEADLILANLASRGIAPSLGGVDGQLSKDDKPEQDTGKINGFRGELNF